MNIELSKTETYKDVIPLKMEGATYRYISIMRGCDKFCTYCIVPQRGRERSASRRASSTELRVMQEKGFREVILLGRMSILSLQG